MKKLFSVLIILAGTAAGLAHAEALGVQVVKPSFMPAAAGPFSPGILVDTSKGNLLFVSGQIAVNPKTGQLNEQDISVATNQVLDNIEAILKAAGSDWRHVARVDLFLKHMDDLAAVNEEYKKRFPNGVHPARQAVQVGMKYRIEISAIAFVPR